MVYVTVKFFGKSLIVSTKEFKKQYSNHKVQMANSYLNGRKLEKVGSFCPVTFRQHDYWIQ